MQGRTTRMTLHAVVALSEGHDVTIVGLTADESVKIAKRVVAVAKGLNIPCANVPGSHPDAPRVSVRGMETAVLCPTPKTKVFVDHRAVFERPTILPPAFRHVPN